MVIWLSLMISGSHLWFHADSTAVRIVGFLMLVAGFIGFEFIRCKERDENRHKFNNIARNFQTIVDCFSGAYKEENGDTDDLS